MIDKNPAINRRDFLSLLGAGAAGAVAGRLMTSPLKALAFAPPTRRPNIVVLMADDLGYHDIGSHGGPEIPTPNIEALFANGVKFDNGYATGPVCSPTRAGFVAGRYQQRFRMDYNNDGTADGGFPASEPQIGNYLRQAGYRTCLVGKWHMKGNTGPGDPNPQCHPMDRGFDEFYGFAEAWHFYLGAANAGIGGPPDTRGFFLNRQIVLPNSPQAPLSDYATDWFADQAVDFIGRQGDNPFYLWVAFNAPHSHLQATPKYMNRFRPQPNQTPGYIENNNDPDRMVYAATVQGMDDAIGRIVGKLREMNLEEDTLIFFLSDNGGVNINDPGTFQNTPLRGYKATTWEGGIRVPFVVQWKGHAEPRICHEPVMSLDILATAMAQAGATASPTHPLDGVDLSDLLAGQVSQLAPRNLYWRMGSERAIRQGNYKLVQSATGAPSWQLYDVVNDIGESTNLAGQNPTLVTQLTNAWNAWNSTLPQR